MDYREQLAYVGHSSQLFSVKDYRYTGGRAEGVRATDVDNGGGLCFTVAADRCMDIPRLSYRGVNCSFITPVSVVSPQYYDPEGAEFLRSFTAGFLTTCGLKNIGSPCQEGGESLGLHGRIGNTPADHYCSRLAPDGGSAALSGSMEEGRLFGDDLVLEREIVCRYGEDVIRLRDRVTNRGPRDTDLSLLYHVNLGYPLLAPGAKLLLPTAKVIPRDGHAALEADDWDQITAPESSRPEACFYHQLRADDNGDTMAGLYNPRLELGLTLEFSKKSFTHFVEWKSMATGEYVLGLEPCTSTLDTRADARENGSQQLLKSGESRDFGMTIRFFHGQEQYQSILKRISLVATSALGTLPPRPPQFFEKN